MQADQKLKDLNQKLGWGKRKLYMKVSCGHYPDRASFQKHQFQVGQTIKCVTRVSGRCKYYSEF